MRLFILLFSLLLGQSVLSASWVGTYASTTQEGLTVEFNGQGQYWLYVLQGGQATSIELGELQADAEHLYFAPSQSATGQLASTTADITKDHCSFDWGQAGAFRSYNSECQTTATPQNNIDLTSIYSFSAQQLLIPQLGVPNATGGFDVYKLLLQLTSQSPVQLQLVGIELISNPINALSALYYPQQQFLYLPVLGVDMGQGQLTPIYELILQAISLDPFIVTEYQPYQYQPPAQDPVANPNSTYTDSATIAMMTEMNRISHETTMNVIANMAGDCYGTYSECN